MRKIDAMICSELQFKRVGKPGFSGGGPDGRLGAFRCRSGFTLLEIMLVVGVLVLVAAIVVPMANDAVDSHRLRASADRIRAAFAEARNRAVRSGNEMAFYCKPGFRTFFVQAFDPLVPAQLPALPDEQNADNGTTDIRENVLEIGVKFAGENIANDSRSSAMGANDLGGYQRILFYPDGTVQSARIFLSNEIGDSLRVELRGLTGTSTVSDFLDAEDVR